MSVLTFKGGVHPHNDGKDLSKGSPIADYTPQGEIVIPLSQHIGAPASPLVQKGNRVLVNQKIGAAMGAISANIHSSVSGTVKSVEPRLVANGEKCLSIVIGNDGLYEKVPVTDERGPEDLTKEEKINLIKEAGIVGMGGAGFPTGVKLTPKNADEIEYYIINGAECEPYLTSDYRRMIEYPDQIIKGVKIVLSLLPKAKAIIAIEDNKRDAIVKMKEAVKGDPDIAVKTVYTKYPQGGERTLIYALTGRMVNSSMLPADVNCVVNNIDTVYAIYEAVENKVPLTERIVTVTGEAISNPQNFRVPIGTNMAELIEAAGGFKSQPEKIVCGGPMMGTALFDLNIPVTKGTSALLCFTRDEVREQEPSNCINCGRCVSVCPGRVMPAKLSVLAENGDKEGFLALNGMECCECGCCSYICPAKRNLTQSIKSMRKDILADLRKK